ncbi:MAG: response regulator [Gemmatimonadales bacterium]
MTETNCIRVLVVDDHPVFRTGLSALLNAEHDIEVIGEASNGEEAIQRIRDLRPDVTLMDLSMPGLGGLDAMRQIAALGLDTKILVLTVHAEEEYLFPVLDAGGSGYVTKATADSELIRAIHTVAQGEVFLYPHAASLLLQRYKSPAQATDDPLHKLTARERDVLSLTAAGYSSSEIGTQLAISPKTVDTYRSRIMQKLDLNHRAQLVRFALQTGLLTAD